jgi:hypothetical protein
MKVNLTLIFILIIATSLTIHTLVHSYLAIASALGRSELELYAFLLNNSTYTNSLWCLRALSWGGLN